MKAIGLNSLVVVNMSFTDVRHWRLDFVIYIVWPRTDNERGVGRLCALIYRINMASFILFFRERLKDMKILKTILGFRREPIL